MKEKELPFDRSPCYICRKHVDDSNCEKCIYNGVINGTEYGLEEE